MTDAPPVFAPVVARLAADAAGHFGGARIHLEPVSWVERPFSHVMRLAVRHDPAGAPIAHLFLKIAKPKVVDGRADGMRDRVARDFDVTSRVFHAMASHPDLGVVPPVACYPEHLAIATEEVPGDTLLHHITTRAAWFPSATRLEALAATMRRVGRWVAVFQQSPAGDVTGQVTLGDLCDYVDHRLRQLVRSEALTFSEHDRHEVLAHLGQLGAGVPAEDWRAVPVHSDLSLGNILVSHSRIVVLDFAMARQGTRFHDLARAYVQLEMLGAKPRMRPRVIASLQAALLHGYDATLTASGPLFRMLLLLHRVNHLTTLSASRASWPAAIYNRILRGRHRRWLSAELHRGVALPGTR